MDYTISPVEKSAIRFCEMRIMWRRFAMLVLHVAVPVCLAVVMGVYYHARQEQASKAAIEAHKVIAAIQDEDADVMAIRARLGQLASSCPR